MLIYKIINILFTPLSLLVLLYRRLKGKEDKNHFLERLAFSQKQRDKTKKLIWFHTASIGESLSVLSIVNQLNKNKNFQILFTSGTTSSATILKQKLPPNVIYQFAPIENLFVIHKFLNHWQPSLAIFVESEFWPLILTETKKHCKIISLNTSISEKSLRNWNKFPRIKQAILNNISFFVPKSAQDYKRLELLGATKIKYLGNIKYCAEALKANPQTLTQLKNQLSHRNIVLFASTHTQEEHVVFEIYHQLKKMTKYDFLFIVAPRHPNKIKNFLHNLTKKKIPYVLHSTTPKIEDTTQFYIVDTLGELGTFFSLSPITIMGGTFEKIGGHNIIEPSKLGSLVINGPYDYNIAEMSQEFTDHEAMIKVANAQECSLLINSIFTTPLKYQKYTINAANLIKEKNNIITKAIQLITNELQH